MTNQPANREALISIALGAIVTVIAAVSVINLLFPNSTLIPFFINSAAESSQSTTN